MRRASQKCLGCDTKPAKKDSHFCSQRCGWVWAEGMVSAGELAYCDSCGVGYSDGIPEICSYCGKPTAFDAEDRDEE